MIIFEKGMQRKRRTELWSLGNGKVVELKLFKHDGALWELNGFCSVSKFASK